MTVHGWRARTRIGAAALLSLTGALAGGVAAQQAAQRATRPAAGQAAGQAARPALPATQALFDRYVAQRRAPGLAGAFGMRDAPTVFVSAGRIALAANAPAAGPDSLWRIYSMTKPVTAMAAMILVGEGRLGLDDPLARYFPAFATMRVLTDPDRSLDSRPATRAITVRMLLTHTAGFSYNITARGPILKEYERLGLVPAAVNATVEAQLRPRRPATLAAFAERVAQAPLIAEPGTKWSYSISLDVLGAVIEKASGMPFDRFVQTRLLDPLRMRSTVWQVPRAQAARFATNYVGMNGRLVPIDPAATSVWLQPPSFAYGGAGLVSSARDYDRFLHMLQNLGELDGVRVMKPETVRLATSNLLPPGVRYTSDDPGGADGLGYGAGGYVTLADRAGTAAGTYGWDGAANTVAWVNPQRGFRGVVMANVFPPGVLRLRETVPAALARDLGAAR